MDIQEVGDPEVLRMTLEDFCLKRLGKPRLASQILEKEVAEIYKYDKKFPPGLSSYLTLGRMPIWYLVKHLKRRHFLSVRIAGRLTLNRISRKFKEFNIIWPK